MLVFSGQEGIVRGKGEGELRDKRGVFGFVAEEFEF
jgi:hypothetical protein